MAVSAARGGASVTGGTSTTSGEATGLLAGSETGGLLSVCSAGGGASNINGLSSSGWELPWVAVELLCAAVGAVLCAEVGAGICVDEVEVGGFLLVMGEAERDAIPGGRISIGGFFLASPKLVSFVSSSDAKNAVAASVFAEGVCSSSFCSILFHAWTRLFSVGRPWA